MDNIKEIGLKFCGGCNPRYDRVEVANTIKRKYTEANITETGHGQKINIVICGCTSACADISNLSGEILIIKKAEDLTEIMKSLDELLDIRRRKNEME